jgi:hypothetical protein
MTVALQHTPLDPSQLSADAQKATSGAMKLMAARGLAPLPNPGDLLTVLYQLACDSDAKIGEAARKSVGELPDKILQGGLADASLDPRVLDYFATLVADKAALVELVILNGASADETITMLAGNLGPRGVDLIAQNEQRLLRCPEIVGAMYTNLGARMSTVDRAVELAVRAGLKVPGIPAWEEVSSAVMGSRKSADEEVEIPEVQEADAVFAAAAEQATETSADDKQAQEEAEEIPISQMTVPMKIRLATLGNKFQRALLIRDAIKLVAAAAIKAPGVSDMEAAKYASNHSLADEVISYIAGRRDWTKLYGVRLSLVYNPKTPIATSIRFLTTFREKDLAAIARSKGIPSALAAQARKRLLIKQGKK